MFVSYTNKCKQQQRLFMNAYKIFFIILELITSYQLSSLFYLFIDQKSLSGGRDFLMCILQQATLSTPGTDREQEAAARHFSMEMGLLFPATGYRYRPYMLHT